MKKIIYSALAFAMIACNSPKVNDEVEMVGTLNISVTRSESVEDPAAEGRTTITTPAVEELAVEVTGNSETYSWATLGDFNADVARGFTFKAAPYTLFLSYGEKGVEGYNKPYFEGSTQVEIQGYGLTTTANVEVALANSIVAIATTSNFDGYFQQETPKFSVNGIEWNSASKDMLFLNPGTTTIKCDVVKPSGNKQTITLDVELKAQTRHTVVFDLPNAGSAEITVKFDSEILNYNEEEFEMNDNA